MKDEIVNEKGRVLNTLRLNIEGAIRLYEGDAAPLYPLALEKDPAAARAFDAIGTALYELRRSILSLDTDREE